jgi:hypothetical protein
MQYERGEKKMIKTILHLCADVGSDSQPYRDGGYNVICVGKDVGVENYIPPHDTYGIIANPPCTYFSFCRTNAKIPRNVRFAMNIVQHCLRIIWTCQYRTKKDTQKYSPLKFWVLENPNRGMLRWFLGKPALVYSPYQFGDDYRKETALWGMFNEPIRNPIQCTKPKFDMLASNEIHPEYFGKLTRTERRSICSPMFAQAFFMANQ